MYTQLFDLCKHIVEPVIVKAESSVLETRGKFAFRELEGFLLFTQTIHLVTAGI